MQPSRFVQNEKKDPTSMSREYIHTVLDFKLTKDKIKCKKKNTSRQRENGK